MRCASRVTAESVGVVALLLLSSACGQLWPQSGQPRCDDFTKTVQPLLTQRCVECHGEARASGDYRLDSWAHATARRLDGSTRVTGEHPLLLAAAAGELPDHTPLSSDEQATLQFWVGTCHAGDVPNLWHLRGWATVGDPNFHGMALRQTGYDITSCVKCHGEDLAGGKSGVSCKSCHGDDVFSCTTCHGSDGNAAPPKALNGSSLTTTLGVGAHRTHVGDGPLHKAFTCDSCHPHVAHPFDEGHFRVDGGPDDGIAEVILPATDGGVPEWNRAEATCTNTACHAPDPHDTAATNMRPVWTEVDAGQADCGTCHGRPPAWHGTATDCALCHVGAVLEDGGVNPATHVDGIVEVGYPGRTGCNACHSDGTVPGPFHDTHDRTDPTLASVGAHRAHLEVPSGFANPITCDQCHVVPKDVRDPGHMDHPLPALVFPDAGSWGSLARADNAQPAFDPATATCTNAYCHGGGARAALDGSPTKVTAIVWNGGRSQVYCGSCHGVPPATAIHSPSLTLGDCATCHSATIDSRGNFVFTPGPDGGLITTHMNGVVDSNDAGM